MRNHTVAADHDRRGCRLYRRLDRGLLGPDMLFIAGVAAATVATFFLVLPRFLFTLLGSPAVESTHGQLKFTAPLTGITAAVVGVILNLAVFFAYYVLWPKAAGAAAFSGPFECHPYFLISRR